MNKTICLGTFIDIKVTFDKTEFSSIKSAQSRNRMNKVSLAELKICVKKEQRQLRHSGLWLRRDAFMVGSCHLSC